jgi:tetratricopeptide (TPR) repeat protein
MGAKERLGHDGLCGQRSRKVRVLLHAVPIHILSIILAFTVFFSCTRTRRYYVDSRGREVNSGAAQHYNQGIAYSQKGQYDLAISEYTKAIEIYPHEDVYYGRGNAYVQKGQYDLAIGDFSKAIELDPKYLKAYFSRGNAYLIKSQYDKAILDFTKAIEIDPKHANSYWGRGIGYCQKGQVDLGLADLNNAKKLDPSLKGVDRSIAECTDKQKRVIPQLPTR